MRLPFLKKAAAGAEPLVVSMTGARLGDSLAFWGISPELVLPLAARVGLSGRALVVGPAAQAIEAGATRDGILVETSDGFPSDGSFECAVVEEAKGWERAAAAALAAVRPGGRIVVVSRVPRTGLFARLSASSGPATPVDSIMSALDAGGWHRGRSIGGQAGLTFVEAFR